MFILREFVFWWAAIALLSLASRRLLCNTGGTVFSTGVIISAAALSGYWVIHYTQQPLLGWAAFTASACALGGAHASAATALGAEVTLVASVIAQMMWSELWLAVPWITGGSGGLLWHGSSAGVAILTFLVVAGLSVVVELLGTSPTGTFRAAVMIEAGRRSEVFGVDRRRWILCSYVLFALVVGGVGYAIVNWIGYLSLEVAGIPFTTAILLIALATQRTSAALVIAICACQAAIRVVARNALSVSSLGSHCLDIVLPLLLLILIKSSYTARANSRD